MRAGDAARKIVDARHRAGEIITLTALTLARLMVRDARVAVVDLAGRADHLGRLGRSSPRRALPR